MGIFLVARAPRKDANQLGRFASVQFREEDFLISSLAAFLGRKRLPILHRGLSKLRAGTGPHDTAHRRRADA